LLTLYRDFYRDFPWSQGSDIFFLLSGVSLFLRWGVLI
jgi:hypothetical protein